MVQHITGLIGEWGLGKTERLVLIGCWVFGGLQFMNCICSFRSDLQVVVESSEFSFQCKIFELFQLRFFSPLERKFWGSF